MAAEPGVFGTFSLPLGPTSAFFTIHISSLASYRWACSDPGTGGRWAGPVAHLCFRTSSCSITSFSSFCTVILTFWILFLCIIIIIFTPQASLSSNVNCNQWPCEKRLYWASWSRNQTCLYCASPPICRWDRVWEAEYWFLWDRNRRRERHSFYLNNWLEWSLKMCGTGDSYLTSESSAYCLQERKRWAKQDECYMPKCFINRTPCLCDPVCSSRLLVADNDVLPQSYTLTDEHVTCKTCRTRKLWLKYIQTKNIQPQICHVFFILFWFMIPHFSSFTLMTHPLYSSSPQKQKWLN